MILGDSRICNFEYLQENRRTRDQYRTVILYKRGAKISDLEKLVLDFDEHHNREILFVIAAGINNFTKKKYNKRNEFELISAGVNSVCDIVHEALKSLKRLIFSKFERAKVVLCTIPHANLQKYNEYRVSRGKLSVRKYSDSEEQGLVSIAVDGMNEFINHLNFTAGVRTISLHKACCKEKKESHLFSKLRPGSLYDGLHPTRHTEENWFRRIHQCAHIMLEQ